MHPDDAASYAEAHPPAPRHLIASPTLRFYVERLMWTVGWVGLLVSVNYLFRFLSR